VAAPRRWQTVGALTTPLVFFFLGTSTHVVVRGRVPLTLVSIAVKQVVKMPLFAGIGQLVKVVELTAAGVRGVVGHITGGGREDAPMRPFLKVEHAVVEGTVGAPVEEVWALVGNFEGWMSWWPAFTSCTVTGSGIGQKRTITYVGARSYVEVLTKRDDKRHVIEYHLVESHPELIAENVRTAVELVAAGPRSTRVTWSSAFQPIHEAALPKIRAGQMAAYEAGISALQDKLSPGPPVRPVRLSFTKLSMNASSSVAHLTISVGDVVVHSLRLTPSGTPVMGDVVTLQLASVDDVLELALEEKDTTVLGKGTISASVLLGTNEGPSQANFDVELSAARGGSPVATYTLSVINAPPPSPIEAATKLLLSVGQELQEHLMQTAFLIGVDDGEWRYASYPQATEKTPLPKFSAALPPSQVIRPTRVGHLFGRNMEFLYAQARLLKLLADTSPEGGIAEPLRQRLAALQADVKKVLQDDPFCAPFNGAVAKPQSVVERWTHDDEVADQMIRGVNPMKIVRVTDNPADVLPALLHNLVAPDGRNMTQLCKDNALFYVDYPELMAGELDAASGAYTHQAVSSILDADVGARKYWYAPRLVLYKKASGKLSIVGFTLTRKDDGSDEVYTAATHPPMTYLLAKCHLTCADNQAHQFVSHLGMTHLLAEPFIVAAHNSLPTDHIVSALLRPHFVDTIGINFLARQTLVSSVAPFTDATFSVGTANALTIFSTAYATWDFLGDNFVNGLAKRGFGADASVDGLDGFHYRDDGFKVWNALTRHVARVLQAHYGACGQDADGALAADADVAAWCAEMRDPKRAAIASFPEAFKTLNALTEALVSIIFMCSAQHAAVNFPQAEYVTYVPNRPDSLRTPMPPTPTGGDLPQSALGEALPDMAVSLFQALFGHLLSAPTDTPASAYAAVKESHPNEVEAFTSDLLRITQEIDERNQSLVAKDEQPYNYLSPENMPLSIDI